MRPALPDLPEAVQEVPDFRTFPASWICSLWLQLAGLSASDRLARAVEDCLSSESPWLRGSALYFLRRLPRAAGLGEVLALAREPGSLTTEWPARYGTGEELATPLEVLLERLDVIPPGVELDPVEEQAALFLREQVVSGPAGGHPGLLSTVADYFGEWLATHIEEIAEQWPGRWKRVLDALVRSEQEEFAAIAGVAIVSGDRVPIADLQAWLAEPWNQYGAHGMVIQSALRGRRG